MSDGQRTTPRFVKVILLFAAGFLLATVYVEFMEWWLSGHIGMSRRLGAAVSTPIIVFWLWLFTRRVGK
jgi:hypothetical protein